MTISSTTTTSASRRAASVFALSLASAALVISGCSGTSASSSDAGAASSAASAPRSATGGAASDAAQERAAQGASGVSVADQKLSRTGSIAIQVTNITEALGRVRAINASADGFILSENVGSSRSGVEGVSPDTYAAISISVPSKRFDATLDELQKIGEVLERRSETANVTAEYVDTAARIASMKRSVERIQGLIDDTADIEQLVKLERELSSRQTELEAVQARLQQLDRETDRAPITINLTTKPELVEGESTTPKEGFVGGLQAGWEAFVASLVGLLTILGAILPFALVAALIAWPVWRVLRRRRRSATKAPSTPPSGPFAPPQPKPEPAASEAE